MPDIAGSMQKSGALADALQDLLRQMYDKIIGGPTKGKNGEPLSDLCCMIMPLGEPIDPRDYSFPWDPSGGDSSSDVQDDGKLGTAAAPATGTTAAPGTATTNAGTPANGTTTATPQAPVPDKKLQHAMQTARQTAWTFDRMLRVTNDGSYRPFTSAGTVSSSYEAIITKAQGIPAPPLPADIQKQIDTATRVLYVFDDAGNQKGQTKAYKNYQFLKQAYADAETAYANAQAEAMTNPSLGQVWPVTSKSFKAAVDNAYDDWRSSGAQDIENALETVKAIGGSIGNHFLAQARTLYDAWGLGLSGSVAVNTPFTQVLPSSWYDATDQDKGFTKILASNSQFQASGQSQSAQAASSWYNGHSSSTGGGGGASFLGISVGASGSHGNTDDHSGSNQSGNQSSSFSSAMSNVTIKLDFGLCTIYRPWLLRELFVIDGWYLPGEKDKVVSDGTIGGQAKDDDAHLLPMIPTQFLVVQNVSITASGWGQAGQQMSDYCKQAQHDDQSSSTTVSGSVGFLGFGGSVSHSNADWSGADAESASCAGSWFFSGNADYGTLSINGAQIVGWIGEILPASPKLDGTKQSSTTTQAASAGAASSTPAGASTTTSTTTPAQPVGATQ